MNTKFGVRIGFEKGSDVVEVETAQEVVEYAELAITDPLTKSVCGFEDTWQPVIYLKKTENGLERQVF